MSWGKGTLLKARRLWVTSEPQRISSTGRSRAREKTMARGSDHTKRTDEEQYQPETAPEQTQRDFIEGHQAHSPALCHECAFRTLDGKERTLRSRHQPW